MIANQLGTVYVETSDTLGNKREEGGYVEDFSMAVSDFTIVLNPLKCYDLVGN